MAKPIIIFGAGASHDVIDCNLHDCSQAYKPPLTDTIFDKQWGETINQYPRMRKLMPEIRARIKNRSLEEVLKSFRQEMEEMTGQNRENRELQLIEIELYLKSLFTGVSDHYLPQRDVNNYITFLTKLKEANITEASIITFNYDLFLDRALSHVFGYQYKTIANYHQNPIKYYKVHGSVDWFYHCDGMDPLGQMSEDDHAQRISNALESNLSLKMRPPTVRFKTPYKSPQLIEMPHLAIPEPTDKEFKIKEHYDLIANDLKQAEKIIIIGWSAGDDYFVDLIEKNVKDKQVDLIIVGVTGQTGINLTLNQISAKSPLRANKWKSRSTSRRGFSGLWADDINLQKIFS